MRSLLKPQKYDISVSLPKFVTHLTGCAAGDQEFDAFYMMMYKRFEIILRDKNLLLPLVISKTRFNESALKRVQNYYNKAVDYIFETTYEKGLSYEDLGKILGISSKEYEEFFLILTYDFPWQEDKLLKVDEYYKVFKNYIESLEVEDD